MRENYFQTLIILGVIILVCFISGVAESQIRAGTGKQDITDYQARLANDPLFVKALALSDGKDKYVIITLDVVAIEEIGPIKKGYLENVRARLDKELNIKASNILVNVSHCHGIVRKDAADLTVQAVGQAFENMVPVSVGTGRGYEDRIMENRRYRMKDGSQVDVRRAYSLPPDDEIKAIGPIDPEIGIIRFDRKNGAPLAVVYNFAVHPIEGVPNGGNTADIVGFASKVIEENLDGAMAFFLQGCGGDINPVNYKSLDIPQDAEPLGNLLGLSTLRALKDIKTVPVKQIGIIHETMDLPISDFQRRIDTLEAKEIRLLRSLKGTDMNLKAFIPLLMKYNYSKDFPLFYAQRYFHDEQIGRYDMLYLDSVNRSDMNNYFSNIYTMEHLTRIQENLRLVKMHQRKSAGMDKVHVEVNGWRIGDAKLITFPGELTVQIGLNLKKKSQTDFTFVIGYTNGYIYYCPTAEQLRNTGEAQEDCDTMLAPEWQDMFENKALEILNKL